MGGGLRCGAATYGLEALEEGPIMSVLLVEHYLPLAKSLLRGLEEQGIAAHLARDDVEGDRRARADCYAAVVVDWNIPRKGGAALVRGWRRDGLTVPVVILMPSTDDVDL